MKKNRLILCLVMLLVVAFCICSFVACNDDGDGTDKGSESETCIVTFAGVKTTRVEVKRGEKVAEPEAQQKKSGYTFVGWYLGNSLYDFDSAVNEDITLEAKFERDVFDIAHGVVFGSDGNFVSGATDSLMVFNEKTFSKGTFTASVTPYTANDCGVIFGLSDERNSTFWEDERYFCAIINKEGYFILAEVIPSGSSSWNEVANSDVFVNTYLPTNTYTFEVAYVQTADPKIGYVEISLNNVKVASTMINALSGSGIGYRAQADGVKFSQLSIDEAKLPTVTDTSVAGDFRVKSGQLSFVENNSYVTGSSNTLAIYKDLAPQSGNYTISTTIKKDSYVEDDGIVFALDDNDLGMFWENAGVSYYFFFISLDNTAYLGKVTGGEDVSWHELGVSKKLAYETEYELKVVVSGSLIECYVNDTKLVTYTDENMLSGNIVGIRAGGKDCKYTNFSVTENVAE